MNNMPPGNNENKDPGETEILDTQTDTVPDSDDLSSDTVIDCSVSQFHLEQGLGSSSAPCSPDDSAQNSADTRQLSTDNVFDLQDVEDSQSSEVSKVLDFDFSGDIDADLDFVRGGKQGDVAGNAPLFSGTLDEAEKVSLNAEPAKDRGRRLPEVTGGWSAIKPPSQSDRKIIRRFSEARPVEAVGVESLPSRSNLELQKSKEPAVVPLVQKRRGPVEGVATEGIGRLLGLVGVDQGREIVLTLRETTLGRSSQNIVHSKEASMSRFHATIVFDGACFSVVDHDSGNGTFVNNVRVSREAIKNGDELRFGKGSYRFVEESRPRFVEDPDVGVPVQAKMASFENSKGSRFGFLVSALFLSLSVIGLAWVGVNTSRFGVNTSGRAQSELLNRSYKLGLKALYAKKWKVGEQHFIDVLTLDPQDQRGLLYLKQIGHEEQQQILLEQVRDAVDNKNFKQGQDLLAQIQTVMQAQEYQALQKRLGQYRDTQLFQASLLVEHGRYRSARILLRELTTLGETRIQFRSLQARVNGAMRQE
jgi:hypothetical protein